jgi:hypothetical protein
MSDFMDFKLAFALQEYECTSHWFSYILYEFALCGSNKIGKVEILKDLQRRNQIMTDVKNGIKKTDKKSREKLDFIPLLMPYDYYPHTYKLLEMLLTSHKNSHVDDVRDDCLERFVKASKSFATYFDEQVKSEAILHVGKGEDFNIVGRGRNKKTIKPELIDRETVARLAFSSSNKEFVAHIEKYGILVS